LPINYKFICVHTGIFCFYTASQTCPQNVCTSSTSSPLVCANTSDAEAAAIYCFHFQITSLAFCIRFCNLSTSASTSLTAASVVIYFFALKCFILLMRSFITLLCQCSTRDSLMPITFTCDMHVTMRCITLIHTTKNALCVAIIGPTSNHSSIIKWRHIYFSTSNFRRNVNIMLGNKESGSNTFKTASASASCFHNN